MKVKMSLAEAISVQRVLQEFVSRPSWYRQLDVERCTRVLERMEC